MRIRIWLASATVIALILLLALTVNHAREKDMVELFSRQQLAHAQNTAARMSDIFLQVGKNIALLSYLDPSAKTPSSEIDRNFKILYAGWEKSINAVVLFDSEGRQLRILPRNTYPSVNLAGHFQALKQKPKQYLSLALAEKSQMSGIRQKTDWYLIFGYPVWQQKKIFSGAWIFSFSLANLMEEYEKQIRDNELGDLWLIDELGQIIIHPDSTFIGKKINDLIKRNDDIKIDFSKSAFIIAPVNPIPLSLPVNQKKKKVVTINDVNGKIRFKGRGGAFSSNSHCSCASF